MFKDVVQGFKSLETRQRVYAVVTCRLLQKLVSSQDLAIMNLFFA